MSAEEWRPAKTPEELRARFPALDNARVMDPRASTQVQAVLRAEEIIAKVWGEGARVSGVLFDPARVPALAQRADAAAADFHCRAAEMQYDTDDTDYDRHDTAEQGVVKIWQVGGNHVHIVRDRWRDAPNRAPNTVEYAAGSLGHGRSTHDHWKCTEYGCDHEKVCDLQCHVGLAKACGGATRLLPVDRSPLVMLFRCCRVCEDLAGKIAENTYKTNMKIAELEAREDWPPGEGS
jgi:hypothetical protein